MTNRRGLHCSVGVGLLRLLEASELSSEEGERERDLGEGGRGQEEGEQRQNRVGHRTAAYDGTTRIIGRDFCSKQVLRPEGLQREQQARSPKFMVRMILREFTIMAYKFARGYI